MAMSSRDVTLPAVNDPVEESGRSALMWGPILGGAAAAGAATLVLVAVGSALGLSSVSAWPATGATGAAVGIGAIAWLVVTQWLSAAFGGYLTGRLRTRWVGIHTDEVFFRDSAHGLLAWAVATLAMAAIVGTGSASIVRGGAQAVATVASGAAQGAIQAGGDLVDPTAYYTDSLFRAAQPTTAAAGPESREEASRILVRAMRDGALPAPDRDYLAGMIASRTGLSKPEAETRIDEVMAQAKEVEAKARQAAEDAREAGVVMSFVTAISLLLGALVAAAAGALGGRDRDDWSTALLKAR